MENCKINPKKSSRNEIIKGKAEINETEAKGQQKQISAKPKIDILNN